MTFTTKESARAVSAATLGLLALAALLALTTPVMSAPPLQLTPTNILAEAIQEANVRAGAGVEYDLLGTITSGTRYQVYGQHEFFPWLLIAYPPAPQGQAWVFADLVTLSVPLSQVPVLTDTVVLDAPSPTVSPTPGGPDVIASTANVLVTAADEVNVRFGPGVDYPRIGRMVPGVPYTAESRHALYPWLRIIFPDAPDGLGWVHMDVVDVSGDIYTLPVITAEQIGWPTLTPTPPFVITSEPPWQPTEVAANNVTPALTPEPPSVDMAVLGENILAYLLSQGFIPEEDRFGSVFILNLQTGENLSLGTGIAYSGMSLIKIPILVEYYRQHHGASDARDAELIASTMICSDNIASNELLTIVGGGDPYEGARAVTETLRALGLRNTFIAAPFDVGPTTPPIQAVTPPTIDADQERAFPDPYNQVTPVDLGWLMSAIYECAMNESGPLLETFPDLFTPTECRQMIQAMSANQINVLTEAGVPEGTRVAHKHGWIDDTHGDAAIVFTPGGDFVLTMAFYQPDWLPYETSWPAMAEVARLTYNAFNPTAPLAAIHPETVDETCDLFATPLLAELSAAVLPPIDD
ncbi:MAG: serine hydrolase [Anaerolineae bacterium]|nr:serine hydrolase [Anaerolineae bacterium]